MKSAVLVVALVAARYAFAVSRSGYGYSDVMLHVLEWITYLKRLSLIALMLIAIVLYYEPKSRSHIRQACCTLIDFIANGLKSVLSITEIKYEHVMTEEQRTRESRVQKQHRKLFKENADLAQRYEMNTDGNGLVRESRRKQEKRKSRTKHSFEEEHERYRLHAHHHHHHRNAVIRDISLESHARIMPIVESPQQKVMDEKFKRNDGMMKIPRESILSVKIDRTMHSLRENADSPQEGFAKTDYSLNDIKTESSSYKKAVREITNKDIISDTPACKSYNKHPERSFTNNHPIVQSARVSDNLQKVNFQNKERQIIVRTSEKQEMNANDIDETDKNLPKRQRFNDMIHEKIPSISRCQSISNCTSSIMSKQLLADYYEDTVATYELQRENHQFLLNMKKIVDECCYENASLNLKNQKKPVLIRVFNWLFGGCPEAAKRCQRVKMVEKPEETFEHTNAWTYPSL